MLVHAYLDKVVRHDEVEEEWRVTLVSDKNRTLYDKLVADQQRRIGPKIKFLEVPLSIH